MASKGGRKCPMCKHGVMRAGHITVTLERPNGSPRSLVTVVFRNVPARICEICGEQFLDEKTTGSLLRQTSDAAKAGVQVEVRSFAA